MPKTVHYSAYSEKKRNTVECSICHTTQGRMIVQLLNSRPRYVCEKHHDSKLPSRWEN